MKLRAGNKFQLLAVLALLVGLAAVVASAAALAPHDDGGEGRSCLVCKAGSQPFQLANSSTGFAPALRSVADVAPACETADLSGTARLRSPRAPPL